MLRVFHQIVRAVIQYYYFINSSLPIRHDVYRGEKIKNKLNGGAPPSLLSILYTCSHPTNRCQFRRIRERFANRRPWRDHYNNNTIYGITLLLL